MNASKKVITDCRHFTGYKPCGKSSICDSTCAHVDIPKISLLIVHLGALGAVVRATSILKMIKRKYPSSRITWVTDKPADQLLKNNNLIDRVYTTTEADLLCLGALNFEIAFVIDKSLKAFGVINRTHVDFIYGFKVDPSSGAILPATSAAEELWDVGLDDNKKFFVNKKTEVQLMAEALELPYQRDDYYMPLSQSEMDLSDSRRSAWLNYKNAERAPAHVLIGLNTGCSSVLPYKKMSIELHRELILKLNEIPNIKVVLLGGPEDIERNNSIAEGLDVIRSPENLGLRDGYASVAAMDIVVSGDSLGMHMAIAAKKHVVAWFGPTCAHEIELYDRGSTVLSKVSCGPCWKKSCQKEQMCYDQVSITDLVKAVEVGICERLGLASNSNSTDSISGGFTFKHSFDQEISK